MTYDYLKKRAKFSATITLAVGLVGCLIVALVPAYASATPAEERYIVTLKDNSDSKLLSKLHAAKRKLKVKSVFSHAMKGYSASMTPAEAKQLAKEPSVATVEKDGIVSAALLQSSATWGLDRIDQRSFPLTSSFSYTSSGVGVTAYVLDTGVRTSHADFGGRVSAGFDAVDGSLPADDCNGHGTHVAGTIGSATYGVAKGVTIVPVRVLDCNAFGYWSWVIAGIDWVTAHHQKGKPAVANMSLSGGKNSSVNSAVSKSIQDGVSYVFAAGNDGTNACNYSPASVSAGLTIGATDNTDTKASWSNYGSCIDWFAPGVNIVSTSYVSDAATAAMNGTSMASPHVAGVAAQYLQKSPTASPSTVRSKLYNLTTKNIVKNSQSYRKHLLYTNY